jgi:uncharacterized metal-binding protein YceD (DUF177 family)
MNDRVDFSRVFSLNHLGDTAVAYTVAASAEECQHLANRFELLSLNNLIVDFQVTHGDAPQSYILKGELEADVVQACVLTLQDVPAHVHSSIDVILLPRGHKIFQGEQEMDTGQDYEPLDGDEVDLGEVAAQYLALALNSYPRHPSAVQEATFLSATTSSVGVRKPFQALASLKHK